MVGQIHPLRVLIGDSVFVTMLSPHLNVGCIAGWAMRPCALEYTQYFVSSRAPIGKGGKHTVEAGIFP